MLLAAIAAVTLAAPTVTVLETPNSGIQPQAALDAKGTLHLIYFTGKDTGGNLQYVQSKDDGETWTNPIQVNSKGDTAVATGTIRGGQIAVSPNGNVHVVWLGPSKDPGLFYAYMTAGAKGFAEQKDVATDTYNLDGGASVACDEASVYVLWHANAKKDGDEPSRQLWLRVSRTRGETFNPKISVANGVGACACCSTKAAIDGRGRLVGMFRSAGESIHRDAYSVGWSWSYVASKERLDSWEVKTCPMSSFAILPGRFTAMAWENKERVVLDGKVLPGERAKHPSLARIDDTVLCAYILGSGWQKGGSLAWCILGPDGKVLESSTDAGKTPVWGLVSAVATKRGYLIFR